MAFPDKQQRNLLRTLAKTYIWWKTPEEALRYPDILTAQILNMGDWNDILLLTQTMGTEYLRQVVRTAQAGQFDERSWHFWHYKLHLASSGKVPPLPERTFQ